MLVDAASATPIAVDVLAHLDAQLLSARRLLAQIARQSAAIHRRDADAVLATMTDLQGEMASRGRLESERTELLWRAGSLLGVPADAVRLSKLADLMDEADADEARLRSAELRGLLSAVEREHAINRSLMRQERAFLEHLTPLLGGAPESDAYPSTGPQQPNRRPALHIVDGEA